MNNKTTFLYVLIYLLCFFVLSGFNRSSKNFKHEFFPIDHNTFPFIGTYSYGYEDEIDYEEPLVSGPIKNMPWDDDMFFSECKEKSNTPILMAAYRTVLKDPLPGEEFNVHLAASLLCSTVVKPGEVLSQNMLLGPYTKEKGYREGPTYIGSQLTTTVGGGVCKISSTLYNIATLSNLQIIERHSHSMPVPYVPYGQDATVAYGVKDFKLRNNTDFPVMIWAQGIGNILYMAFYSMQEPPQVEWHHEILETREAPCIYKINTNLADAEEKIIIEGMDGAIVKSWISIYSNDGSVTTKQLGISNYLPMPYIIERNK